MGVEANKSVVRRFTDGGLLGKPEVFDEICSPDFVNHAVPSRTGIQGLKDVVAFSKRAQPDQHWSQLHIIAEGDLVVLYGVREAIWQAPEFRGYPTSQGIRIAVELAHMCRSATSARRVAFISEGIVLGTGRFSGAKATHSPREPSPPSLNTPTCKRKHGFDTNSNADLGRSSRVSWSQHASVCP